MGGIQEKILEILGFLYQKMKQFTKISESCKQNQVFQKFRNFQNCTTLKKFEFFSFALLVYHESWYYVLFVSKGWWSKFRKK